MTFNPWIFFIYWTTGSFSLEELFLDLLDLEDRLGDLDFFDDLLSCRGDLDDLEFFDDLPGLGLGDLEDLLLLLLLLGDFGGFMRPCTFNSFVVCKGGVITCIFSLFCPCPFKSSQFPTFPTMMLYPFIFLNFSGFIFSLDSSDDEQDEKRSFSFDFSFGFKDFLFLGPPPMRAVINFYSNADILFFFFLFFFLMVGVFFLMGVGLVLLGVFFLMGVDLVLLGVFFLLVGFFPEFMSRSSMLISFLSWSFVTTFEISLSTIYYLMSISYPYRMLSLRSSPYSILLSYISPSMLPNVSKRSLG